MKEHINLASILLISISLCSCKQTAKNHDTHTNSLQYIDSNIVDSSLYVSPAEADVLDNYIKQIEMLKEVSRFKIKNDSHAKIKLYKRKLDSPFFYSSRTELQGSLVYEIQVGYDDELRYTNFFTFFLNPKTSKLFYLNTINDSLYLIKEDLTKLPKE